MIKNSIICTLNRILLYLNKIYKNNYNIILIIAIKKKLLNLLNAIGYKIGIFVYGKITNSIEANKNSLIEVFKSKVDNSLYTIFKIKKCRIYTDTVTDTAFIIENKIIEGPSFQHREGKNADVMKNIVITKGTPRIKKK